MIILESTIRSMKMKIRSKKTNLMMIMKKIERTLKRINE